jgi:hypothetical protein
MSLLFSVYLRCYRFSDYAEILQFQQAVSGIGKWFASAVSLAKQPQGDCDMFHGEQRIDR